MVHRGRSLSGQGQRAGQRLRRPDSESAHRLRARARHALPAARHHQHRRRTAARQHRHRAAAAAHRRRHLPRQRRAHPTGHRRCYRQHRSDTQQRTGRHTADAHHQRRRSGHWPGAGHHEQHHCQRRTVRFKELLCQPQRLHRLQRELHARRGYHHHPQLELRQGRLPRGGQRHRQRLCRQGQDAIDDDGLLCVQGAHRLSRPGPALHPLRDAARRHYRLRHSQQPQRQGGLRHGLWHSGQSGTGIHRHEGRRTCDDACQLLPVRESHTGHTAVQQQQRQRRQETGLRARHRLHRLHQSALRTVSGDSDGHWRSLRRPDQQAAAGTTDRRCRLRQPDTDDGGRQKPAHQLQQDTTDQQFADEQPRHTPCHVQATAGQRRRICHRQCHRCL